jgi:hypothetical protein
MQYVWRFGEEQLKSNGANENSTNYEMLKMILEANLNLMNLSEKSTTEEQEIITYSTLKGIMEFGKVMEGSFDFAKS